jgi:hypothetical protein
MHAMKVQKLGLAMLGLSWHLDTPLVFRHAATGTAAAFVYTVDDCTQLNGDRIDGAKRSAWGGALGNIDSEHQPEAAL